MRFRGCKKYAIGAGGMLVLVTAVLLATGAGSAVAAQITNVFVTNDAAHPVPVTGTLSTRSAAAGTPWNANLFIDMGGLKAVYGPTNSKVEISSITWSPESGSINEARLLVARVAQDAANCDSAHAEVTLWGASTFGTPTSAAFPTPIEANPSAVGGTMCLMAGLNGGTASSSFLSANGFIP
jgi:hypothetical protein